MVSKEKDKKEIKKAVPQTKECEQKQKVPAKKVRNKVADEKSARVKKAKSPGKLITWTILIAMVVGTLVFLCKSEMFNICNIEITGNKQVSVQMIRQLSEIKLNNNIFLANTIKAANKISQNPYIKEVNVKRELPDKIKIEIVEKQKAYMIQLNQKIAYIDKNGDILEVSTTR